MKPKQILLTMILFIAALLLLGCHSTSSGLQPQNGDTVQVNYTGRLQDGTVFDSTENREPLEFTLGEGRLIQGFEKAVLGMKVGEKKTVTIPASEAYGNRRADLIMEIPRSNLSDDVIPEVGMQLQSQTEDGSPLVATIIEVTTTTVTLDANTRLAGQDLTFDIELLRIVD